MRRRKPCYQSLAENILAVFGSAGAADGCKYYSAQSLWGSVAVRCGLADNRKNRRNVQTQWARNRGNVRSLFNKPDAPDNGTGVDELDTQNKEHDEETDAAGLEVQTDSIKRRLRQNRPEKRFSDNWITWGSVEWKDMEADTSDGRRRKQELAAEMDITHVRNNLEKKIVEFIKTQDAQNHLTGIHNGSIPSQRHQAFYHVNRSVRGTLEGQGSGFITSDELADELFECLADLDVKCAEDRHFPDTKYVGYVLMPEAIVYGLHKVKDISMEAAQKLMDKGPEWTPEERVWFKNP
ncbi:uncharacterized protein [Branchiostoma lanceolatum]|uniref:uncharacterized protein isoform X2 n=1 Tax=Branchiostoma lanceolatum TaxID=7740 RepID=UPI003454BB6D